MRSRDRMRSVTEGIEAMGREEAAYGSDGDDPKEPTTRPDRVAILLTEPSQKK